MIYIQAVNHNASSNLATLQYCCETIDCEKVSMCCLKNVIRCEMRNVFN